MNFKTLSLVMMLVGVVLAAEVSTMSEDGIALDATERTYDRNYKKCFKKIVHCCYKYKPCGYYCKWIWVKKWCYRRHHKYDCSYKKYVCYKKYCPKLHCDPEVIEGDSTPPKPFEIKVHKRGRKGRRD